MKLRLKENMIKIDSTLSTAKKHTMKTWPTKSYSLKRGSPLSEFLRPSWLFIRGWRLWVGCALYGVIQANEQWVGECYANPKAIKLSTLLMEIKGKLVHFGAEEIDRMYGLPNSNQSLFNTKDCDLGSWLVSTICLGKNVPWATMKVGITPCEFMVEARIWPAIICSYVSPWGNMNNMSVK